MTEWRVNIVSIVEKCGIKPACSNPMIELSYMNSEILPSQSFMSLIQVCSEKFIQAAQQCDTSVVIWVLFDLKLGEAAWWQATKHVCKEYLCAEPPPQLSQSSQLSIITITLINL